MTTHPYPTPRPLDEDGLREWATYEYRNRYAARDYYHREHGPRHCYCGRRISAQIDECCICAGQKRGEA